MKMNAWVRCLRAAALTLVSAGAPAVSAEVATFAKAPIRYIVPAPPGGLIDIMARMMGQQVGNSFGQPLVIENRPGANTVIGAEAVARSAPDGQTWLAVSISLAANATLTPMTFDLSKDLVPVARLAVTPMGLAVPRDSPYNSMQELLAAAKGGKALNYGSSGYGTPTHLATALLESELGKKLNHIPYKGGAPALNDLMGGQLDFVIVTVSEAKPFIDSARLRLLAVAQPERLAGFPSVPTTAEAGYPKVVMTGWTGIMVAGGTPKPIVDAISAGVLAAAKQPAFVARAQELGFVMAPQNADEFKLFFDSEVKRLADLIKAQNIKIE